MHDLAGQKALMAGNDVMEHDAYVLQVVGDVLF